MAKKAGIQLTNITNRKGHNEGNELLIFNAYTVEDAFSKSLYVCQSGIKKWRSPGWLSGPAIYDHYIIHYLIDGEGLYYCRGNKYPIKAGDMFLIEPYVEVSYQADIQNPYQYYWVGFNGLECHDFLSRCGFSEENLVVSRGVKDSIIAHMDSIANIRSNSYSDQFYLTGHLYQLFGEMVQDHEQAASRSSKYYFDALAFIRQNACLPDISAKDVAAHIGVERSHLYRIFQENSQYSIKEIITGIRMEKAKLFLTNTDQSIEYIANYSGYKNVSHFCRLFREIEGVSPLQYRRQEKKGPTL